MYSETVEDYTSTVRKFVSFYLQAIYLKLKCIDDVPTHFIVIMFLAIIIMMIIMRRLQSVPHSNIFWCVTKEHKNK